MLPSICGKQIDGCSRLSTVDDSRKALHIHLHLHKKAGRARARPNFMLSIGTLTVIFVV